MTLGFLRQATENLDDDLELVILSGNRFIPIDDIDFNTIQVELTPKETVIFPDNEE